MTRGNLILFKGAANTGKTHFAYSTINEFLNDNPANKAIYVGLTQNSGTQLLDQLPKES